MLTAEQITHEIRGFTDVMSLALEYDSLGYELRLHLANQYGEEITLNCSDVSGFDLKELGGGLSQILMLQAFDVRSQQLDRIRFEFRDIERSTLKFCCKSAEIARQQQGGHL
jgi:hypothetical protein